MTAEQILQQHFGYSDFRKGQKEAIDGILSGHDVLGIMPTGAGKSICFQVPALLFSGLTLVISPLISLMRDQVMNLANSEIAAGYINSSLTDTQIKMVFSCAKKGEYHLLYVAPERLLSPDFLEFAQSTPISMVVVDEAHCISQWGQDFRISYSQIPNFIEKLPVRPILSAFTATATPQVKADIINLLQLDNPLDISTSFDRENLFFMTKYSKNKFQDVLDFLAGHEEESGIVYCSTRSAVEDVCLKLNEEKILATKYHAGLSKAERDENQTAFLYDAKQVMVATNAFGMGIDKSNVSFVVHYNLPKDMESYYQEAGRAGRDGAPAECLLLHNERDVALCKRMIAYGRGMQYENDAMKGILRKRAYNRLAEMELYANGKHCLRHTILRYFGEDSPVECGNCGECNTKHTLMDITVESQKIISCVARGRENLPKSTVIDVLRGVESPEVLALDLCSLTTFGISKQSKSKLSAMIDHLIWKGFLDQSHERTPKLVLTPKSVYIAKGMVYLDMKMPVYTSGGKSKKTTGTPADTATNLVATAKTSRKRKKASSKGMKSPLFEDLRAVRTRYAKAESIPPFMIFSNATLLDMCEKHPQTAEELLRVSGVGQVKLEKYGKGFLEVLQGREDEA